MVSFPCCDWTSDGHCVLTKLRTYSIANPFINFTPYGVYTSHQQQRRALKGSMVYYWDPIHISNWNIDRLNVFIDSKRSETL